MEITAKMVAELRQMTGVGMMECKKALAEAEGNMDKAVKVLSELGKAKVAKKAGRIAAEGVVGYYDHMNMHQKFAMVELNCETDFAAKNPQLFAAAKDLAMQVVATNPIAVRPEDLPASYVEEQKALFKAQLANDPKNANKPEMVLEKIIEGKLNKHFEEVCLLNQAFIKDGDVDVKTYVANNGGEIVNCIRYEVGEGMEKRNDDFAAEVAAQAAAAMNK